MFRQIQRLSGVAIALVLGAAGMLFGCYKELPPQPQAQAAAKQTNPTAAPSTAEKPVSPAVGGGQPASSALGSAKRSAENTVQQAQQASQNAIDQANKDH